MIMQFIHIYECIMLNSSSYSSAVPVLIKKRIFFIIGERDSAEGKEKIYLWISFTLLLLQNVHIQMEQMRYWEGTKRKLFFFFFGEQKKINLNISEAISIIFQWHFFSKKWGFVVDLSECLFAGEKNDNQRNFWRILQIFRR